jgi:hypothetical protein
MVKIGSKVNFQKDQISKNEIKIHEISAINEIKIKNRKSSHMERLLQIASQGQ